MRVREWRREEEEEEPLGWRCDDERYNEEDECDATPPLPDEA